MAPGSVVNADALPVFPAQSQTPTLTSGVAATLVKGFGHKTPLILSNHTFGQSSQSNNPPAAVQTLSQMTESNILQQSLELSNLQPSSLCNVIEQKFCRVLCNDGSSTMIQVSPGLTVYQALTKIFAKKQIPWYKCDIYFVSDYQPVDQQMDSQALGSKEIYLEERCLFALSLIPIAINICVKGNLKKSINSVLQPILDSYQIKYTNCAVYLNSANYTLNLSELCATIDNQHVLVVHKHQSNLLSQMEIEKFMSVSINDFIPANFQDYQMQFDELGILKKCIQIKQKPGSTISTFNPPNSVTVGLSTSPNSPGILSTAPVPIPSPVCALMTQQVQTQPPLQTPPQPSQQVPQTAQLLHVTSAGQISVQQSQPAQPQIQHIRLGLKSVNEEQEV